MNFKQYATQIYYPMQQQARAVGVNPSDVNTAQSMQRHLAPGFLRDVEGDVAKEKSRYADQTYALRGKSLDLRNRQLGTENKAYRRSQRMAPWAIGLGVGNVGLSYAQGINERNLARQNKDLLRQYITNITKQRR